MEGRRIYGGLVWINKLDTNHYTDYGYPHQNFVKNAYSLYLSILEDTIRKLTS